MAESKPDPLSSVTADAVLVDQYKSSDPTISKSSSLKLEANYRGLVMDIVHRIAPANCDRDDVEQEAWLAFYSAVKSFKPATRTRLSTLAYASVTRAVLRCVTKQHNNFVERKTPDGKSQYVEAYEVVPIHGLSDELHPLGERNRPEFAALLNERDDTIHRFIESLPAKDQLLMHGRFWAGKSWSEVGDELGLRSGDAARKRFDIHIKPIARASLGFIVAVG